MTIASYVPEATIARYLQSGDEPGLLASAPIGIVHPGRAEHDRPATGESLR
jgi:hypothetical protein